MLSPAELHALKVLAKDADKVRDQLPDDKTIPLDFGVHIVGDLIVNGTSQFSQAQKPDMISVIAAVLAAVGGPKKRATLIDAIIYDGLANHTDDKTSADAQRLVAGLTVKTVTERRGGVTGKFDMTPVRPAVGV
jgi:uncharacterized membrane protein